MHQAQHDEHEHRHGTDCGHESMEHEGHTDFMHDGHRHAEHQGHWDEHGDQSSMSSSSADRPGGSMSQGPADRHSGQNDTGGS